MNIFSWVKSFWLRKFGNDKQKRDAEFWAEARQVWSAARRILTHHPNSAKGPLGEIYEDDKIVIRAGQGCFWIKVKLICKIGDTETLREECVFEDAVCEIRRYNRGCWVDHLWKIASDTDELIRKDKMLRFAPVDDFYTFQRGE